MKVTPDPRVRLVNGYTLQIRDAVPSDFGDYICQIGTLEPREITHHVEILSKDWILENSFISYVKEKTFASREIRENWLSKMKDKDLLAA